jgi:threonyl-tRNA synthetase
MEPKSLEGIRHSLAHVLAAAVLEHDPKAKLGIGPVVENGFYYDILFSERFSDEALPKLEARMRELVRMNLPFTGTSVTADEARARFASQPFKLELIDELAQKGEQITLYTTGDVFIDLCRGGHVSSTAQIDPESFSLSHIAGAYWKGSEKNPMLTRIYGLAFETKAQLDTYVANREEARKRDHRKIGAEMDLFLTSELVGSGLPLWTPRGTVMRAALDAFVWELRHGRGYERVTIPHITKKDLYETSGHWTKFADELFRITTREGKEYALKPMNCPHHTQIFARRQMSYRDMPQRYAESTMVYRDEQSGELGGLTRVLSITQDDSHVFCRHSQVKEEFFKIWDIVDIFYGTFGFSDMRVRLSFHEPSEFEKYLGTKEIWHNAESALREIAQERNANFFEAPGEAAMYGPKLDFMAKDSMGREHQVATIQLDMNLPERFDLTCINEKGEKERIVMIHCAIMGSFERFMAVFLEHTGGVFPTWIAPVQVAVLPVGENQHQYAGMVADTLRSAGIRVELDESSDMLGKKVRRAKESKVPYYVVVGEKEQTAQVVAPETCEGVKHSPCSIADFAARVATEVKNRTPRTKPTESAQ